MKGAIIGDILGSYYAEHPTANHRLELARAEAHCTQNTLLAAALCELLYYTDTPALSWVERKIRAREIANEYKKFAARYPELLDRSEKNWTSQPGLTKSPVSSAAAAVAALPCAYVCDSLDTALMQTELACRFLYNSDTSKACAKAAAAGVFLLRNGAEPDDVKDKCGKLCGADFSADYDDIRDGLTSDRSPKMITAAAFTAFFKSHDFESAARYACACGGDSHIIAAISCALAQAYFKVIPEDLKAFAFTKLDAVMKKPIERFCEKYDT